MVLRTAQELAGEEAKAERSLRAVKHSAYSCASPRGQQAVQIDSPICEDLLKPSLASILRIALRQPKTLLVFWSRTELMSMDGLNTGFAKTCKPLSREKCIFRDALKFVFKVSTPEPD